MIKQQSLYQLENTDLKLLTAYCIQNQPSTSSLLGWLLNSPQSCPNEFSNAIFYCSAPNPWALIAQNQTVVWLIEIKDRIRIFVSSEPFLDQCPTTDLAVKYCEDPETSLQGPMFIAADHQALYKESENLLEQLLKTFMENKKEILVHGCSVIWSPLLRRLFKIPYNGPCKRFVNPASKYPLPCSLRNGYSIAKAEKKHAPLIIEYNKIKFEMQYVIEGLEMSTVITTQDNTPVAWAMSHRDLTVGALHVLGSHRRQGLAEAVVADICGQHTAFYQKHSPDPTVEHYAQAIVEYPNSTSASFFKKLGWYTHGPGITWVVIGPKEKSIE